LDEASDNLERAARDGDRRAFGDIVRVHWDGVFRLSHRLCRSPHDAEELTQDTFLKAMQAIGSYTPGSNLRAWLLRIASNLWLDRTRRRTEVPLPSSFDAAAVGPAVGAAAEFADEVSRVMRALDELPTTTRAVAILRSTEHLGFDEIGAVFGFTAETARWHMHKARAHLAARLGNRP